jgi:23S rRNA (adenine2503-C2)-methyltransferase
MKDNLLILVGKCGGSTSNIKKKNEKGNISIKYVWKVPGIKLNQGVESGYFFGMDYHDRHCLTISTQQGCFLAKLSKPCTFCVTGRQKYLGQLTAKQIVQQILYMILDNNLQKDNKPIEIAYMGMGEPGFNYEDVAKSIESLEKILPKLKLKSKRYIFATVGVPSAIIQLGKDISSKRFGNAKIRLHFSLHAHTDEMRNEIVPINKQFPIKKVFSSIRKYIKEIEKVPDSDKKISINYMLFNNFEPKSGKKYTTNKKSIEALSNLLNDPKHFRPVLCEFNNSSNENDMVSYKKALELKRILVNKGYDTKIFGSFGHNIKLACGQLSGRLDQLTLIKKEKIMSIVKRIIKEELK